MKISRWQIQLGGMLIALSLILYLMQNLIFQQPRQELFYFFQDLAFVPVEVLIVTLIIHRYLTGREKRERLTKMNMVIGAFFNEVGTGLIERSFPFIQDSALLKKHLLVSGSWNGKQFEAAISTMQKHPVEIDSRRGDLSSLKQYLSEKRIFLLRLLENPNLLEHDTFTDLLWAVFHLADELEHRPELIDLPEPDYDHLSIDIRRADILLFTEWLSYLQHLKSDYPYLFSLAIRTNPFDPDASAFIGKDPGRQFRM